VSGGRIFLSAPDIRGPEHKRVREALASGWLAPVGPDLDAFEAEVARVAGRGHGVGITSGSAAIELTLRELGVGPGDEVLVSTLTFAGSAFPVVHCGATPVFIDSEADGWNLSPDLVAEELADRRRTGRAMPKAAVVTDLYGQCADYHRLVPLLAEHGVVLVEDAAEAIGARLGGRLAGSFGKYGILSFNGNKLATTSGGGVIVGDDEAQAVRFRFLASQAREPGTHYEHVEVGYSCRLSNLLAALGRGQLDDLPERLERRKQIRERYEADLADVPGVGFQPVPDGHEPNHWLTCITVDPVSGVLPDDVVQHLELADIESRPAWKPMHLQPVFADAPCRVDGTAEAVFRAGVCLPSGGGLDDEDLDRVVARLHEVLRTRG
jgi:dTDP-4-amino-4,6-dideoxygalactose transaminase